MEASVIALVAINARFSHASLGARFLLANSPDWLREQISFLEFNINDDRVGIEETIVALNPAIVAIGVYIWNRTMVDELVAALRRRNPAMTLVLGGPEITYDTESPLGMAADCIIRGEGERLWPDICTKLLQGAAVPRLPDPCPPDAGQLVMPDAWYTDLDIRHRKLYVEASRGCPLACDFCLSSVDAGVRFFPVEAVTASLRRLLARGARQFRFIDRSFNLGGQHAEAVLQFFLDRLEPGLRLHFEMTPDGLSKRLRDLLRQFPPRCLHIETGVQSFHRDVLVAVNRRCDPEAMAEGIAWLSAEAGADVHADLIAGLPGETLASFAAGFDKLARLRPSEIQVGILKQLHGTPLRSYAGSAGLRFRQEPPYDVLQTATMSSDELNDVRRFAAHWERVVTRSLFPRGAALMLESAASPWQRFDLFSRQLDAEHGLTGIGFVEMAAALLRFMTRDCGLAEAAVRQALRQDYHADGRRLNVPAFLRE